MVEQQEGEIQEQNDMLLERENHISELQDVADGQEDRLASMEDELKTRSMNLTLQHWIIKYILKHGGMKTPEKNKTSDMFSHYCPSNYEHDLGGRSQLNQSMGQVKVIKYRQQFERPFRETTPTPMLLKNKSIALC